MKLGASLRSDILIGCCMNGYLSSVVKGTFLFNYLIAFKFITNFNVIESFDTNSAFVSGLYLFDVILESLQRINFTIINYNTVSNNSYRIVTIEFSFRNIAAGNSTNLRYFEHFTNSNHRFHFF